MQSYSFMCKNTFLACVGHMLDMWDPHQSISWPQEPLFRDQDHQNWTKYVIQDMVRKVIVNIWLNAFKYWKMQAIGSLCNIMLGFKLLIKLKTQHNIV